MPLDQHFNHKEAQKRFNRAWDEAGVFTPSTDSDKPSFVITLPPPNVTGILHVGHVLGDSVQDLFVRWKRMKGFNSLFVPGTDHAGIATQKVVENRLLEEGIRRQDLSREEFLEHAWEWKEKHHKHIVSQLKNLGASLDWTREAFTLDGPRSEAVRLVFVKLYEKGLIYRGDYTVNWCPSCETAISDEEVEHKEKKAKLYWIRYPLEDGSAHVTVATTRPETLLGDSAVAVSPDDAEKRTLVGKSVILPLVGRRLPIIADEAVDPEFGSGFVKVTPAHDPNDFEMGRRHDLASVVVIDRQGKITDAAPAAFQGLDRFEARKKVLAALEAEGLLEKVEPYTHSVGQHDRCHTVVEPLLSREWFVKMKPLAKPAIEVVENGEIDFYPPRWRNVYMSWMRDIRDWCISRRLWWGHRIPVWYCPDGHLTVTTEDPDECAECGHSDLTQDDNVLDTWFSSWLWTFSPLGWPQRDEDVKRFHPTSVLVTAPEIIFFWVARMIMASLEFLGEIPFRHVFLTGIVRDTQGRKMSKSLGNSPDPLDIIDKWGTDAFRFTLVMLSPPGRDVFFAEEKLDLGRNFINKIWQASRMILGAHEKDGADLLVPRGSAGGAPAGESSAVDSATGEAPAEEAFVRAWNERYGRALAFEPDLGWEDRWILSALTRCAADVDDKLKNWRVNEAAARIYDFFWSEFCDWYLELAKIRLYGEGDRRSVLSVLLFVLGEVLTMLHPVVPYVTEALWSELPMSDGLIIEADYARARESFVDTEVDARMELFQGLVTATRNIRSLYHVNPSQRIELRIKTPVTGVADMDAMAPGIRALARVERLVYGADVRKERGDAATPVGDYEVVVPLAGIADVDAEVGRLGKEKLKLERDLSGVAKKLGNTDFLTKAKPEVVERVRARHALLQTELGKIEESLAIIAGDR